MSIKSYQGRDIEVTFELKRCIHAAECVRRLPSVFNVARRPWVLPDNATADQVQQTIDLCPSGALKYSRRDGGSLEPLPDKNTILVTDSAEYQVRGDVQLVTMNEDTITEEYRLTLCRCGESNNKPFCDNTHRKARFVAPGQVVDNSEETADLRPTGKLKIVPSANGPLLLQGNFEMHEIHRGSEFSEVRKQRFADAADRQISPFVMGLIKPMAFQLIERPYSGK